ncbi:MAG: hypothetical protein LBS69_07380, partial [Prevotellaceae bacterium]|nr:hypothetical protein [Prevotellaceae bacterium]
HFAEQFIKDLNMVDVKTIDQIQWIFDGKKISSLDKTKFLDELRKADISNDVIKKWMPKNLIPTKENLLIIIENNFDVIVFICINT